MEEEEKEEDRKRLQLTLVLEFASLISEEALMTSRAVGFRHCHQESRQ